MFLINISVLYRIVIFLFTTQGALCLRNVHITIPEAVERGKAAVIKCIYDLENEVLYQVKWYKEGQEFCRYSPRDVPPLKVFPIPGVEVDRKETNAEKLKIKVTTQQGPARYTCEVSADAPSFLTAEVHGSIEVVDLPKSDPELNGLKHRYRAGMKLKAECISRDSMPAANLSFFINNEPIRCSAYVYSIYFRSYEKVAEEERDRSTITPLPDTRAAIVFPIHRISENDGSENRGMSYCKKLREVGLIVIFTFVVR